MKVRNGFVSNSSSSSFVIDSKYLSKNQIKLILAHRYCQTIPYAMSDQWDISWSDDDRYILLDTMLDNFDMYGYLTEIVGLKDKQIMDEIPPEPVEPEETEDFCDEAKRILEIADNITNEWKTLLKRSTDEN